MQRNWVAILVIILGVIALGGIIYVIFFHNFSAAPVTEVNTNVNQPAEQTITGEEQQVITTEVTPLVTQTIPVTPTETALTGGQTDLARLAAAFSERFGSYSNQSDYSNIRDLKIFMSSSMKAWADEYIRQAILKNADTSIYYGITTKAVTTEIKSYDEDSGQAEILIKTQRREATGTTANASSFYQDIIIKFVKEDGAWKVDSAYWQDR